jgi:hypothetical protein
MLRASDKHAGLFGCVGAVGAVGLGFWLSAWDIPIITGRLIADAPLHDRPGMVAVTVSPLAFAIHVLLFLGSVALVVRWVGVRLTRFMHE